MSPKSLRSITNEIDDYAILTAIGEGSRDVITSIDAKGRILSWTSAAERLLGYTDNEIIGQSIDILVPENLREYEHEQVRKQINGEIGVFHEDTIRLCKSGEPVEISLTRIPLKNRQGKNIALLAILKDVSEQKKLQQEVDTLQRNTAMAKVAAKVAHEIRTPLGVLFLKSDLLVERLRRAFEEWGTGDSEKHQKILEKGVSDIQKQINRLEEIATNYLHLSKTGTIERVNLKLRLFMRDVVSELKEQYDDRIQLEYEVQDNLPAACLDAQQFQRVFSNLTRNSVEAIRLAHIPNGKILFRVYQEGETIRFEVKDNGPGIPKEIQQAVFDPFTTSKSIGTGLGLYLVREIVENHDGSIHIQSEEGKGTTIHITIPLERDGG